jgi:hypothetical protein
MADTVASVEVEFLGRLPGRWRSHFDEVDLLYIKVIETEVTPSC